MANAFTNAAGAVAGRLVHAGWEAACHYGMIGPGDRRGRRFARMGEGTCIGFPVATLYGERWIEIGEHTRIGPYVSLSAGMSPDQEMVSSPVVSIGDRCVLGRGTTIVGHLSITIGDDVWGGHNVFITDQNHAYDDIDVPIGLRAQAERPVSVGDGSWLGHACVLLPGATIGKHVVVGAGAVVSGVVPDNTVVAGNPARVVRHHVPGQGWIRPPSPELGEKSGAGAPLSGTSSPVAG